MVRPAPLRQLQETRPQPDEQLSADRLDFDTWLLPPELPSKVERSMRLCSTAAGPITFGAALVCLVAWIV